MSSLLLLYAVAVQCCIWDIIFVEMCGEHGINSIGPIPDSIRVMGDKSTARDTMKNAGVPTVPWSNGLLQITKEAVRVAEEIGNPVVIKRQLGFHISKPSHSISTMTTPSCSLNGAAKSNTNSDTFVKYFGKYGEIIDSVITKDRMTGRPRGFGFITYEDPSVVDTVIAETHIINDKQVERSKELFQRVRQIPKISKPKRYLLVGYPTSVTEEELKTFFSKYGNVVEHEIIRDHITKRSRGFGFVVFDSEQVVDNILGK